MQPRAFRCGHPDTPENTRKCGRSGRCVTCHRLSNANRAPTRKRPRYLETCLRELPRHSLETHET
jgi:hypothetical protein